LIDPPFAWKGRLRKGSPLFVAQSNIARLSTSLGPNHMTLWV
jgi:hypothetical protein